jgi:hypothetical protein
MSYASKTGRARTNPTAPEAHAICQRCGFRYNRVDLHNQHEWRGAAILPLQIFVCDRCLDVPQEGLRAIIIPSDPVPVLLPFPEPFQVDEPNFLTLTTGSTTDPTTGLPVPATTSLATVSGLALTTGPIGRNPATASGVGLDPHAIMPFDVNQTQYNAFPLGVPLSLISVTANGSPTVSVTCSRAHGLVTNDQIAVEGLSNGLACGFFSVTVTGAMSFTYQTYSPVPAGGLLTSGTRMVTADAGRPRTMQQLPQVGP